MTTVYFVRHAQPDFTWKEDRTRPLTTEGLADRAVVLDFLKDKRVEAFYSSPYRRSYDTIAEAAGCLGMPICTDERLRERESGEQGNGREMLRKRWADFDFHEPGGECLRSVQERNIMALFDLLDANPGRTVVVGTHGTALSMILHYFHPSFDCDDFLRIVDWMPFIVKMRFEGHERQELQECLHVYKEYKG